MDLKSINESILNRLCETLKIRKCRTVNKTFLEHVCRKLSADPSAEGSLDKLFNILMNLGINLNHIDKDKVMSGNHVHTYLILDFLNVLLETLLSENPDQFTTFIKQFKSARFIGSIGGQAKERDKTGELRRQEEVEGGATSGAEEIDRILQEAQRKYGKIRSFRERIDKENISIIPKVTAGLAAKSSAGGGKYGPDLLSEVDNRRGTSTGRAEFTPTLAARKLGAGAWAAAADTASGESSLGLTSSSSLSTSASSKRPSHCSRSDSRSDDDTTKSSRGSPSRRTSTRHHHLAKKGKRPVAAKRLQKTQEVDRRSSRPQSASSNDDGSDANEVNVRIPLEEASLNVRIKTVDNVPLENRRIHVRVRKDPTPRKRAGRRIVYGTKSVLYHHHRKPRAPLFSRRPVTPPLPDKEVMPAAVARVAATRREKRGREEEEEGAEMGGTRGKEGRLDVDWKVASQKYLREARTRNGQLRKALANLQHDG